MAPAVAIGLMIVVVGISFVAMRQQRAAQEELTTRYLPARATVGMIEGQVATTRGEVYRLFTMLGNFDAKRIDQERTGFRNRLIAISAILTNADLGQDPRLADLTTRCVAEIANYSKKADDAIELATGDVNTGIAAPYTLLWLSAPATNPAAVTTNVPLLLVTL